MITIDIDIWKKYKEARDKRFDDLCELNEFCNERKNDPGFKDSMVPPISIENCLEWLDRTGTTT